MFLTTVELYICAHICPGYPLLYCVFYIDTANDNGDI